MGGSSFIRNRTRISMPAILRRRIRIGIGHAIAGKVSVSEAAAPHEFLVARYAYCGSGYAFTLKRSIDDSLELRKEPM